MLGRGLQTISCLVKMLNFDLIINFNMADMTELANTSGESSEIEDDISRLEREAELGDEVQPSTAVAQEEAGEEDEDLYSKPIKL